MTVRVYGEAQAHDQQHNTSTSGTASKQQDGRNSRSYGHVDEGTLYLQQQSERVSEREGLGTDGATAQQRHRLRQM